MSVVLDTASFKTGTQATLKLPPVSNSSFKNPGIICRENSSSMNFSNSSSKVSSSVKYQLNYGVNIDRRGSNAARNKRQIRTNGLNYLKSLPSLMAVKRDALCTEDDVSRRPAFPEGASVSLPTSTTTLQYLLHMRDSRTDATDDGQSDAVIGASLERIRSLGGLYVKARSTSDASFLSTRRSSAEIAQQFFRVEPCLYTHQMFLRATKVLEFLKEDEKRRNSQKSNTSLGTVDANIEEDLAMEFKNVEEQIKTFELALAILKFQMLLEKALHQTNFFTDFPLFQNNSSLVSVVLYDLLTRKFQKRTAFEGEQICQLCNDIEEALLSRKTRLQAFIAKERVKHNASSIEHLLPQTIRNVDEVKQRFPVYMWINQMKTTIEDIISELEDDDFRKLISTEDISEHTGKVFQIDRHCSDLLVFPSDLITTLKHTKWVMMGQLVEQDKSSCLSAQSVQYLLGTDKDVIHVNIGSGMTTAHLASLLKNKSSHSHIYGFGIGSPSKVKRALQHLEFLGAGRNVKLILDDFISVDPEEPKFKSVKVIFITANCSKSAITNPVHFLISEEEDIRFLADFAKAGQSMDNVSKLVQQNDRILKHALSFPRVQAVVYCTRSRHEAENEALVTRALEFTHATSTSKGVPFRVTPPVLPFTFDEIDSGTSGIDGLYVKFLPTDKSNGCFVAVISREPEEHRDGFRSAASARWKGLLGKAKSTPVVPKTEPLNTKDSETGRKRMKGRGGVKLKQLKGVYSASDAKPGVSSKLAGHKSPAAVGARMYQASLVHKMEQRAKQRSNKAEHLTIIKIP